MYCIKSSSSSCYLNFPLNIKFHLGQWGKSAKGEKMQTIGDKTKYQTMLTPCTFKASPFVSMGGGTKTQTTHTDQDNDDESVIIIIIPVVRALKGSGWAGGPVWKGGWSVGWLSRRGCLEAWLAVWCQHANE